MKVLIDYLVFFVNEKSVYDVLDKMGLIRHEDLFSAGKPILNFKHCISYDHINILWNVEHETGGDFYVLMPGAGCRTFEDLTDKDEKEWYNLLYYAARDNKIMRIDIAADDTEYLDIKKIESITRQFEDKNKECVRTRFDFAKTLTSSKGVTCYWGSPKSVIQIRIYDKGAERGKERNEWIRCELQVRKQRANDLVKILLNDGSLGKSFALTVNYYLQFLSLRSSITKQNRKVLKWWKDFLGTVEKRKIIQSVGREYNMHKLINYLDHQAGSSLTTLSEFMSDDQIIEFVRAERKLNKKQLDLISQKRFK